LYGAVGNDPFAPAATALLVAGGVDIQGDPVPHCRGEAVASRCQTGAGGAGPGAAIAAAQTSVEPEPEPAVALVAEAEMVAAVPESAPPLPRRELDAEPVAPPPRAEPASIPAGAEAARPNYELFAAFRAATDQGRADAVRRGDGGGA
jgi:hypothetical protein